MNNDGDIMADKDFFPAKDFGLTIVKKKRKQRLKKALRKIGEVAGRPSRLPERHGRLLRAKVLKRKGLKKKILGRKRRIDKRNILLR